MYIPRGISWQGLCICMSCTALNCKSTEDPLYTLHCNIRIYVCLRNRRDSFLTSERKGNVSRRVYLGTWISGLTKEEKILKKIFLNTNMHWLYLRQALVI